MYQDDDDTIKVDHLQQKYTWSRDWIRGKGDDVQLVSHVQVIPVGIVGEWDFRNERQPVFVIENVDKIVTSFEQNLRSRFFVFIVNMSCDLHIKNLYYTSSLFD